MKILLDASTPAPLGKYLRGHEVTRADQRGWQGLTNGMLLDAAEQDAFELLISCDQNLRYQQNFTNRRIALLILSTNHWPTLRVAASSIATTVDFMQPGQILRVDVPYVD